MKPTLGPSSSSRRGRATRGNDRAKASCPGRVIRLAPVLRLRRALAGGRYDINVRLAAIIDLLIQEACGRARRAVWT